MLLTVSISELRFLSLIARLMIACRRIVIVVSISELRFLSLIVFCLLSPALLYHRFNLRIEILIIDRAWCRGGE